MIRRSLSLKCPVKKGNSLIIINIVTSLWDIQISQIIFHICWSIPSSLNI